MARYFKVRNCYPCSQGISFKNIDQLRNISGLLNLDKIAEKLSSELIISDMKKKLDPSQYANQKGVAIATIQLNSKQSWSGIIIGK